MFISSLLSQKSTLGSETISDNWKPFKIDENAFYFMLKSLFVLKIITFKYIVVDVELDRQ